MHTGQRVCTGLRDGAACAIEHRRPRSRCRHARRAPPLEMVYEYSRAAAVPVLLAEARGLVPDMAAGTAMHTRWNRCAPPRERRKHRAGQETFQAIRAWRTTVRRRRSACDRIQRAPRTWTRLCSTAGLPDTALREVILALSTTASPGGTRERVSYRDLGVDGSRAVYEGLLDYEPAIAPVPVPAWSGRARQHLSSSGALSLGARQPARSIRRNHAIPRPPGVPGRRARRHSRAHPDGAWSILRQRAFRGGAASSPLRAYEAALIREGEAAEVTGADRAGRRWRGAFGVDESDGRLPGAPVALARCRWSPRSRSPFSTTSWSATASLAHRL